METKNYIFKNAQVGDRVWDFIFGWGTITSIKEKGDFPLTVMFDCKENHYIYTLEGKEFSSDLHPRLFWDEIKFEIPEKPFNLEKELKKLEIIKFECGEENFYIQWDYIEQKIDVNCVKTFERPLCLYFTKDSIEEFSRNIGDKKITKEQFFEAYKKVFG